jgi:hypothetical protein
MLSEAKHLHAYSRSFVASRLRMTLALAPLLVMACDPCAGTPICRAYPEVSYGGQFIEHRSGRVVPGVAVTFARTQGPHMLEDTLHAVADGDGFFLMRGKAYQTGTVVGSLTVTPPPPWVPYVVPSLRLETSEVRGEGTFAGRLLVNPYVMFLGEVYDRRLSARVPGAHVTVESVAGPFVTPVLADFVTDGLGRFIIVPEFTAFGNLDFQITLDAPGDPETYHIPFRVVPDFVDRAPYPILVKFPRVLRYSVETSRRGTGEFFPGVQMRFVRTGGIRVTPDTLTGAPVRGRFALMPTPLEDGTLTGDLTIQAPGFPTEVITNLQLLTSFSDSVYFVGILGYGSQVFLAAQLVNRATGLPPAAGSLTGRVTRTGGLPLVFAAGANVLADSGLRTVNDDGQLPYIAGTADTGAVTFDIEVRVPGFRRERYAGLQARARYDTVPNVLGPFKIGGWFPWYGEIRDVDTGAPIGGAQVTFTRSSGGVTTPATFTTVSGADGRFRVNPIPASESETAGTFAVHFVGGQYRDSTVAGVKLTPTYDDSLRLWSTYRFKRQGP